MANDVMLLYTEAEAAKAKLNREISRLVCKAFAGRWVLKYSYFFKPGRARYTGITRSVASLRKNPEFVTLERYLTTAYPNRSSYVIPYGIQLTYFGGDHIQLFVSKNSKRTLKKLGITLSSAGYSHLKGPSYFRRA